VKQALYGKKMISAKFIEQHDFDSSKVKSVEICKKTVVGSPNYQVIIYADKEPIYLLKIYLFDEADCFHEVKYSNNYIVIGCGEKVHFFSIENKNIQSYELNDYFGHLYPSHDIEANDIKNNIYVASASRLFKFSPSGQLEWKSEILGIDGVVIYEIEENLIRGAGEFDPPGGWMKFGVRVNDGKIAI
jgi:hypothetical protein